MDDKNMSLDDLIKRDRQFKRGGQRGGRGGRGAPRGGFAGRGGSDAGISRRPRGGAIGGGLRRGGDSFRGRIGGRGGQRNNQVSVAIDILSFNKGFGIGKV